MSARLPAVFEPNSIESFDDWEAPGLLNWLDGAVATLAKAEKWTDTHRLNVGHALALLRGLLPDGQYGKVEVDLAKTAGVTRRTLERWRKAYEIAVELEAKGARTEAQRARRAKEAEEAKAKELTSRVVSDPIEANAKPVPNKSLLEGMDDPPTPAAAPVSSGAQTAPALAPGGNSPRLAPPTDRPPSAELGGSSATTPQEPSAPAVSGNEPPVRETPSAFPEASSPGELVAALLLLKPDRLAGVDGPSLRSLLALVRGALEAQAARSKPAAASGAAACPHPKNKRKSFGYVTICEACGQKV